MDNPWREFIENCISGDNYFRASEYRELLADLDRGYAAEARLAEARGLLFEARREMLIWLNAEADLPASIYAFLASTATDSGDERE